MADAREHPYPNFAFRVKIGNNDENDILAGFQEVSGLGAETAVTEYRAGNSKENVPKKVLGLGKTPDVPLKRGVIGSLDLFQWMEKVRNGDRTAEQFFRNVVIKLMAEDRTTPVLEWTLKNVRPMKW